MSEYEQRHRKDKFLRQMLAQVRNGDCSRDVRLLLTCDYSSSLLRLLLLLFSLSAPKLVTNLRFESPFLWLPTCCVCLPTGCYLPFVKLLNFSSRYYLIYKYCNTHKNFSDATHSISTAPIDSVELNDGQYVGKCNRMCPRASWMESM
jgi:hypothetical protein